MNPWAAQHLTAVGVGEIAEVEILADGAGFGMHALEDLIAPPALERLLINAVAKAMVLQIDDAQHIRLAERSTQRRRGDEEREGLAGAGLWHRNSMFPMGRSLARAMNVHSFAVPALARNPMESCSMTIALRCNNLENARPI